MVAIPKKFKILLKRKDTDCHNTQQVAQVSNLNTEYRREGCGRQVS